MRESRGKRWCGEERMDTDRGGYTIEGLLLSAGLFLRIWKEGIFHQYIRGDRYSECVDLKKANDEESK